MMKSVNRIINAIHEEINLQDISDCATIIELGYLKNETPLFCPVHDVKFLGFGVLQKDKKKSKGNEVNAIGNKVYYLLLFLFFIFLV